MQHWISILADDLRERADKSEVAARELIDAPLRALRFTQEDVDLQHYRH